MLQQSLHYELISFSPFFLSSFGPYTIPYRFLSTIHTIFLATITQRPLCSISENARLKLQENRPLGKSCLSTNHSPCQLPIQHRELLSPGNCLTDTPSAIFRRCIPPGDAIFVCFIEKGQAANTWSSQIPDHCSQLFSFIVLFFLKVFLSFISFYKFFSFQGEIISGHMFVPQIIFPPFSFKPNLFHVCFSVSFSFYLYFSKFSSGILLLPDRK